MERIVCLSKCQVKDILTKYALGLFCKNFDRRLRYITIVINENEWLVPHVAIFEKDSSKTNTPQFQRIRKVTLDEKGFLNCSCGKTNEYLLPCVHICRIVNDESFFGPTQFHIRWHKDFCYYYDTDFGNDLYPEKVKLMRDILNETRKNHYNVMGEYRGLLSY